MAFYRQHFYDASVIPKMHMLEEHVIPWVTKWQVGFGFMGEQGAESIHASFNNIARAYANIPNRVDRLKRTVQEHHLRISPGNIQLQPEVKWRKKST